MKLYKRSRLHSSAAIMMLSTSSISCIPSTSSSKSVLSDSASAISITPNGLKNLGNTCYLNAQLQCSYHIPLVRKLILSPVIETDEDEEGESTTPSAALTALQHVFASLNSPLGKSGSTNALCTSMNINPWEQQDTQEFWKLLLPKLNSKPLQKLYEGFFEDYIIAQDESGRERRRNEVFLDLSLDVSNSQSVSASLEKMFTESELLTVEEGNGWKPNDKADEKVDAKKGSLLKVDGLPSVLQLHLMRFQYDWQTDVMSKIKSRFTFPDLLDLSEICHDISSIKDNFQTVYDLQSVIIHKGEFGSGHYYSYVKPNIKSDEWYRINDEIVTRVTFQDVIRDAFGGNNKEASSISREEQSVTRPKKRKSFFMSFFGDDSDSSSSTDEDFGWGGATSCAYVLQYVRRWDIDRLYQGNIHACTT